MDEMGPDEVLQPEGRHVARRRSPFQRALEPRAASAFRRRLEHDLRAAIETGSLVLHYQPRIVLASGAIAAAEALLRWPHPRYGLVSPATFIPLAEHSDLAIALGGYALTRACHEAADWPMTGPGTAPIVAVNVTERQLLGDVLIDQVALALAESGLDPERLEIELAEGTIAATDPNVLLTLAALRDHGVGVVLDRFGEDLAALVTLKRLPLTAIKLHRSLMRALPEDPDDRALVGAIITTAHALGFGVTAEGIEREIQRDIVAGLGADEAQGYLFGHAEPTAAFGARLLFATDT